MGSNIFNIPLICFEMQKAFHSLSIFHPAPSSSPRLLSVHAGVEPLYGRGVLGRASKAFIMGFAVLYYTGKHTEPLMLGL